MPRSEPSKLRIEDPKGKDRSPGRPGSPDRRQTERFDSEGKLAHDLSREEIEHLVHELEVHQYELEVQNEELRSAQAELEKSRNRYSDLYDFAPVSYFTFNKSGLILDVNLTGASQLGIERRKLVKKPFHLYLSSVSKESFRAHLRMIFKEKKRRTCEIEMNPADKKKPSLIVAHLDSIYVEEDDGQGRCRTALFDITAQRSVEATLCEADETLHALISAAPLAIYAIDPAGRVKSWNRAAEQIFGWRKDEVIGSFLPSIPRDREEEFAALHERVMRGETLTGFETVRQRKDGSSVHVNISTALLYNLDGSIRGIMGIAEDITERKATEDEIRKMNKTLQTKNKQVEEASQARKSFFSYISHELKTPLNSIIGFTQLLRNGNYGSLSLEQSRALGLVHKNAGELLRLINNILDLAKIESGKMPIQMIETDLQELLERISIVFEPLIQEKGLRLEWNVAPSFPNRFLTDPDKVKSILGNLLSNAIKFTQKGMIGINLQPLPSSCKQGLLSPPGIKIVVSDTGIGIEQADLEKIFEEYEQASNTGGGPQEYTKGSGLGLAIVRKMVVLLNGKIEVKSVPGSGATFTIRIPHPSAEQ
jgi:PAS domain S-box-containing protein